MRPLRLASLEHQVEAPSPNWLPHPCASTGGVEELAPIQVEPQVDDEVRGRRSPSLSSSSSRRSVIDDGRQSSAAMSLTGIFRWEEGDFTTARWCAHV